MNSDYIFSDDSITSMLGKEKDEYLAHYGTPHDGAKSHSGRYPWGSGKKPFQHEKGFYGQGLEEHKEKNDSSNKIYGTKPVNLAPSGWGTKEHPYNNSDELYLEFQDFKAKGYSDAAIASILNTTTKEVKLQYRLAEHNYKEKLKSQIKDMQAEGLSLREIARRMDKNESSLRSLLTSKEDKTYEIVDYLKTELNNKKMIDVGKGTETILTDILSEEGDKPISRDKLDEALRILEYEGYNVYPMGINTGSKKQSNTIILTLQDVAHKDVYQKQGDINTVGDYRSPEKENEKKPLERPTSIDSSRIYINYADQGGLSKDGTIFIRQGVPDLDLGKSHYAQIRAMVDDKYYMKGMALYSDDIPDGYDIVVNSNKRSGTELKDVLKKIKKNPDNPFGAYITAEGQSYYIDPETGEQRLSPINKIKEEGAWNEMGRNVASQFLGKQPIGLIRNQLKFTLENVEAEHDDILEISNPVIRRYYLNKYAEECDSKSVSLKAAAFPRQLTQVILPCDSLKNDEVYAPNFNDGEKVILIRYPHGGPFESPILTVNNTNRSAKKAFGQAKDAVAINSSVAGVLSGADFDGDQVVVIPTSNYNIVSKKPFAGLATFDDKISYSCKDQLKAFEERHPDCDDWKEDKYISTFKKETGIQLMSKRETQKQMGIVSNLITDMTIQGAPDEHLERAVRHSMTVIDANKHKLNYKLSEADNNIAELKALYQRHSDGKIGGASTLLSRVSSKVRIPERKGSAMVDKETGEISYKSSGRKYYDKATDSYKIAEQEVKLGTITKDLRSLSTGTAQEEAYADFGNKLKAIANTSRKEALMIDLPKRDSKAAEYYSKEVSAINSKINQAKKNKPLERRANAIANQVINEAKEADPDLTKKDIKKLRQTALDKARKDVGATGQKFTISDREWEAIQNNAISSTTLNTLLNYVDSDDLRERSMPKSTGGISQAKISRIKAMAAKGYTQADIADQLGVSASTVNKYI